MEIETWARIITISKIIWVNVSGSHVILISFARVGHCFCFLGEIVVVKCYLRLKIGFKTMLNKRGLKHRQHEATFVLNASQTHQLCFVLRRNCLHLRHIFLHLGYIHVSMRVICVSHAQINFSLIHTFVFLRNIQSDTGLFTFVLASRIHSLINVSNGLHGLQLWLVFHSICAWCTCICLGCTCICRLFERSFDRSRDRSRDRSFDRSIARSIDCSIDHLLARSLARSMDGSLDRLLDRPFAQSLGRSLFSRLLAAQSFARCPLVLVAIRLWKLSDLSLNPHTHWRSFCLLNGEAAQKSKSSPLPPSLQIKSSTNTILKISLFPSGWVPKEQSPYINFNPLFRGPFSYSICILTRLECQHFIQQYA